MILASRKIEKPDGTVLERPTRRIVLSMPTIPGLKPAKYTAELYSDTLRLRPYGTRRGGPVDVTVPWGALHRYLIQAKLEETRAQRARARRARKRGRR